MKADWTAIDELTDLRRARLGCLRLDCLGTYRHCDRDPRECGTWRRLTASSTPPRSALVPSDAEIRARYELWATAAMAGVSLLALVAVLWLAGGA